MAAKSIFIICTSALVVQSALGQCFGRMAAPAAPCRAGLGFGEHAYDGPALEGTWPRRAGCNTIVPAPEIAVSHGSGLSVSSSSATAPTGLAITSENKYEGPVAVGGNLPFLGTAAIETVLPTTGAGEINYGCGDGAVAITSESSIDTSIAPAIIAPTTIPSATVFPSTVNPAIPSWGFKGLPFRGCGCGVSPFY